MESNDEWFTLDDIHEVENDEDLYCISVDSPDHEFLIGNTLIPTHNTDEAKAAGQLKGEAQQLIGSIARLGRAAGVHLIIATQRPDAKLLPGELKSNLGARMACGHMQPIASSMTLDSASATKTPGSPKGRAIYSFYGNEAKMQVYWATPDWIDKWLASRGLNPDGTHISTGPTGSLVTNDFDAMKDQTLDSVEGVDNSDEIARKQAESDRIQAEHEAKIAEMKARGETVGNESVNMSRAQVMDGGMGVPQFKAAGDANHNPLDDWDDVMDAITGPQLDPVTDEFAEKDVSENKADEYYDDDMYMDDDDFFSEDDDDEYFEDDGSDWNSPNTESNADGGPDGEGGMTEDQRAAMADYINQALDNLNA